MSPHRSFSKFVHKNKCDIHLWIHFSPCSLTFNFQFQNQFQNSISKFEVRNSKFDILTSKFNFKNFRIQNSKFNFQFQNSKFNFQLQNSKSKIQSPNQFQNSTFNFKIPNSIQFPSSKVQNLELKIQSFKQINSFFILRTYKPELRWPDSEMGT